MTNREAKATLALYRPGIDGAEDPQFSDALRLAQQDLELARWLKQQGALHAALRRRFSGIPVPEDLAARIILKRPRPAWWSSPMLRLAAAVAVLLGVAMFWMSRQPEKASFDGYRHAMVSLISKPYRMGLETADPERARRFFANNQAPANYRLPASLERQQLLGCATLSWGSRPVALLCFRHDNGSELWLFVSTRGALPGAPKSTLREFGKSEKMTTASWSNGEHTYIIATRGDQRLLEEL
jgi:hypothetical protein